MILRLALPLVITTLSYNVLAQRTSWPMINGDAMRTSNAEIELSFPLNIAETWDIGLDSEDGMIVTEDYLFLTEPADSNMLVAVDAHTGDLLWRFGVPGTGGSANFIPVAWQHLVIAGGQGAIGIYALHRETGEIQWSKSTGSSYTRCPVMTDGLLLIPGQDSLLCVDLANGVDQWSFVGSIGQISPVADNSHVYFGSEGKVYSLSKWTGTIEWMTTVPNGSFSTYALDEQRLYFNQYRTDIKALDKSDGAILWTVELDTNEIMNDWPSCFAQTEEHLVVKFFVEGSDKNHYMVLDKASGDEVNRFEGGWMYYGSPTIINDYVVDFSGGNLLFSNIPSGDTAYMISIPEFGVTYQVIAANDRIYIGANGPSIHVLESASTATQEIEASLDLNAYPNPATDQLNINFVLVQSADVRMEISSLDGVNHVVEKYGKLSPGPHGFARPVSGLPNGVFLLSLFVNKKVVSVQFVKQ